MQERPFFRRLSACVPLAATAAVAACALPAHAQYLITDTPTATLFSGTGADVVNPANTTGTTYDDALTIRTLPTGFTYYGLATTAIRVTTNGNIVISSNSTAGTNTSFNPATSVKRIAPLWDDLIVNQGKNDYITETQTANYEAITWHVEDGGGVAGAPIYQDFQAVLFTGATTIKGVSFLTNDIAFSYNALNSTVFSGNDVTIGIDSGNSSQGFTLAPNAPPRSGLYVGGEATTSTSAVPLFSNNQFLLFRPIAGTGATGYTASVQTVTASAAAPEPGSVALLALSGLPVMGRLARRRKPSR